MEDTAQTQVTEGEKLKELVRILDTDIKGNTNIFMALWKVKGIGFMFSNAVCRVLDIPLNKKIGAMSDSELKAINELVRNPHERLPNWLLNRRKDYETGNDRHIITSELKFTQETDIKILKKIKSYRGMRHASGQPVRGQRTKAHFRKGGRRAVGVMKKAAKAAAAKPTEGKEKK